MSKLKVFLFIGFFLFSLTVIGSEAKKAIEERISPVGQVCIEDEECSQNIVSAFSSKDMGNRTGQEVYDVSCTTCHAIGLAGAPKFGDKISWGDRAEKDLNQLVETVVNGLNGMPPMGLCMDCSEEELTSSVQYMLDSLN